MSMNDTIKAYRAQKGEWNDLREQRVFRRIQEKRRLRPNRRVWMALAGGAAVAAIAIVGIISLLGHYHSPSTAPTEPARPHALATVDRATPTTSNASVITLAQTGKVTLRDGADVSILSKNNDGIVLEQEEGTALYDIVHQDRHAVKVLAAGVEITVVGTLFEVSIDEKTVHVEVKRGVVRVDDGVRKITLQAQESFSVSISNDADVEKKASDLKPTQHADGDTRKTVSSGNDSESLFAAVDDARRRSDWNTAARLLKRIIHLNENRFSQASAQFTLGKVERARGKHASAATLFEQCAKRAPSRSMREDGMAEAALSWRAAGNSVRAKTIARTYLQTYPKGMYVSEMNGLVK